MPPFSEDSNAGTEAASDLKAGPHYIYYRLYTGDGPLESNNPIYSANGRFIGRISSRSVRPPHTSTSLKKYLCKIEGFKGFEGCILYQSLSEQTPLPHSTHLSFQNLGPGLSDLNPMVLVVDASIAEKRSPVVNPVDPLERLERDDKQHYVYYVVYDENGEVVSKTSFGKKYPSLGRINTYSLPPPHTVASLKYRLLKSEGISGQNIQIFENEDSESPMADSDPISILADMFPGCLEDQPIAITYESQENISPIDNEDLSEIQARALRQARSEVEELQKSNETHVRELALVREELEKAKETHANELRQARSSLDRLEVQLKKSNDAHACEICEAKSLSILQALLDQSSLTKKLRATKSDSAGRQDTMWLSMTTGDIFYTDGKVRKEKWQNGCGSYEYDCYLAVSSSGKPGFALKDCTTLC